MSSTSVERPQSPINGDSPYQTLGLTALSTELIYEICTYLSARSEAPFLRRDSFLDDLQYKTSPSSNIRNLRLTCYHLNQIVESILFENLTFNFHVTRPSTSDFDHQLSSLASNKSPTRLYSKHLHIRCLNPLQSDHYHGTPLWKGRRFEALDSVIQTRASRIRTSFDLHFVKAISSLKNLRSVK